MKKFVIGTVIIRTVFTVAIALIFMVSFSMVNSYASQAGSGKTMSGMTMTKKHSKTKKTKKAASKSKKALNNMGAGCL